MGLFQKYVLNSLFNNYQYSQMVLDVSDPDTRCFKNQTLWSPTF